MYRAPILLVAISLAACSETKVEQQDAATVAELEKVIEAEAKSLEEAAKEAVKILDAEIESDLKSEGVTLPSESKPATEE
ncbi:hypothetical protein MNBD_ALPHA04-1921 [hydrothermal vent metagenome]|uniref:Lipoprotein n=1 Tax=hydrothermal vent metagenome TaxID=652676 RepID=A0A3B0S9C5_9ZZZZ